jgi:hypothetical protein
METQPTWSYKQDSSHFQLKSSTLILLIPLIHKSNLCYASRPSSQYFKAILHTFKISTTQKILSSSKIQVQDSHYLHTEKSQCQSFFYMTKNSWVWLHLLDPTIFQNFLANLKIIFDDLLFTSRIKSFSFMESQCVKFEWKNSTDAPKNTRTIPK